jgi:hypothetical protein
VAPNGTKKDIEKTPLNPAKSRNIDPSDLPHPAIEKQCEIGAASEGHTELCNSLPSFMGRRRLG